MAIVPFSALCNELRTHFIDKVNNKTWITVLYIRKNVTDIILIYICCWTDSHKVKVKRWKCINKNRKFVVIKKIWYLCGVKTLHIPKGYVLRSSSCRSMERYFIVCSRNNREHDPWDGNPNDDRGGSTCPSDYLSQCLSQYWN